MAYSIFNKEELSENIVAQSWGILDIILGLPFRNALIKQEAAALKQIQMFLLHFLSFR